MNRAVLFVYRYGLVPLLFGLAFLLSPFSNKLREGLRMRQKQNGRHPWLMPPANLRPVWMHCASGEFEYAKPLLRQLKEQHPELPILVTYYTPSYRNAIERNPLVDYSSPLPYDLPAVWREFLAHHNPRALLIARTDLWPEMLWQTQSRQVPIILFASTLGQANRRMRWWARPWVRSLLTPIQVISCVSEEDRSHFAQLGMEASTFVDGDTRYDEVLFRQQQELKLPPALMKSYAETIFIGASTWGEDEAALVPVVQEARTKNLPVRFIFCPHEPSPKHLDSLIQRLQSLAIPYQLYTQTQEEWASDRVLIVDRTGVLMDAYRISHIAFVGGSFHRRVHSVMEPLASGCWTWFGPRHLTNREACEFKALNFKGWPLALTISCTEQASTELENWLSFAEKDAFRTHLQRLVREQAGASARLLNRIEPHLKLT